MSQTGVRVITIALVLVLGLPLLGVQLSGQPLSRYLEFPPRTAYVQHEPFSWPVFIGVALIILLAVAPILFQILRANVGLSQVSGQPPPSVPQHSALVPQHVLFPWWGRLAFCWTCLWWALAWTRFHWMAPLQEHTFTPLWLGYIVVVNAWTYARVGYCMMLHRPRYFLTLFPLSAVFWWLFEFLNRFVQNWYYIGVGGLSPLEYFLRATIPFSTVLPAVMGTAELLTSCPGMSAGLNRFKVIPIGHPARAGWSLLFLSCLSLSGIGLWPDYLFPFVWIGPLLLIVSLQSLNGRPTILTPLTGGNWRGVWVPALAALICGFWWELWNWHSLAHWEYALPFVDRFHLFEMPLLGYAGYLPFGLECVTVADACLSRQSAGGMEYYFSRRVHD